MKKVIALVLAAASLTIALSGCGTKETSGENSGLPTLRVFFSDDIVPDKDLVAEEVQKF